MPHTKEILADALTQVGLKDMAAKAREGYYHDYLSPLDLPEIQLVNDLAAAARSLPDKEARAVMELRARVIGGEFDASSEEGDEWAASQEGQEAFGRLINKS